MSALHLSNITKSFGDNAILKGISLEAEAGEFIALVGPSGCGKSTLLRIVAGLEHPTSGSVMAAGRELTALAPADRNVAMVFQSYALYPHLTAGQNIAVPLAMRQLSRAQRLPIIGNLLPGQKQVRTAIQAQVLDMARALKIEHLIDRKPGQMSGGQRQRVALARAMVRRPSLFLMDEPLSNLDANLRVHARGEIVDLHRRAGVPTLYVTHDQAEALSMADRVAVMISGTLLQLAPPQVIYDDPDHIEVARFLGQPRINTLDTLAAPDQTVALGSMRLQIVATAPQQDAVTIAVRPEHLRVLPTRQGGLAAHVERMEFLGSEVIVYTKLDGLSQPMVAKLTPVEAAGLAAGMPVSLATNPERVMVFGKDGFRLSTTPLASTVLEAANG
ncbi:ABC transporter ATP-binding protein [Allorhizobium taibaishanense]|uniref:Glycerol-3-phosphate ABC transporter ATP-binding protein n=1 Tax=Allorhizobium taibaishanense TaxID=887144 RepID=A0A1Q9A7B8_9HYPH|nr:ABC transporter ATP-binding protein [Allorhizobium taibaishanense]MBB4008339.1 multiple sugar transport system ATP-binding protein [Allorhizobium taibaishanense]OLP50474.1 glycerol-3-phosphate ABC transporter ATP-binding protein [Allorhizobium taibaishanense]